MYHTSYFGHVATNQKLFPTFAVINDTLAPARTSWHPVNKIQKQYWDEKTADDKLVVRGQLFYNKCAAACFSNPGKNMWDSFFWSMGWRAILRFSTAAKQSYDNRNPHRTIRQPRIRNQIATYAIQSMTCSLFQTHETVVSSVWNSWQFGFCNDNFLSSNGLEKRNAVGLTQYS